MPYQKPDAYISAKVYKRNNFGEKHWEYRVRSAAMQYVFYCVNMMAQVLKATLRHKSTEVFYSLNLKIAVIFHIQGGAKILICYEIMNKDMRFLHDNQAQLALALGLFAA
jgi:hypothetical protein